MADHIPPLFPGGQAFQPPAMEPAPPLPAEGKRLFADPDPDPHDDTAEQPVVADPPPPAPVARMSETAALPTRDDDDLIVSPRSGWGRSCLAGVIVLFLVLGTVGAVGYFYAYRNLFPAGPQGDPVEIEISEGATVAAIAAQLESKGVIPNSTVFRGYLRYRAKDLSVQKGLYVFLKHSSVTQAIDILRQGPRPLETARFTVPEALTLADMGPIVNQLPGVSGVRFGQLATSGSIRWSEQPQDVTTLEGLLYPDTYDVFRDGLSEERVVRKMLERFEEKWQSLDKRRMAELKVTPYEAVVVASLIESEAKIDADRPKIASVIYNRLRQDIPLQIDATLLYAIGHKEVVLDVDKEVDSPYNTYTHLGLTPTPISAPGAKSLQAALNPDNTEFLYYVLCKKDGTHCFAKTLNEFNNLVNQAIKDGVL